MSTVVEPARTTVRPGPVWRRCASCDVLAPLAPDTHICDPCTTAKLTAYLESRFGELSAVAKRVNKSTAARVLRRIRTEAPDVLARTRRGGRR